MTFQSLGLRAEILRALEAQNHKTPTPIQAEAIPPAIAGRDILGCSQTGTGKTAAFALPIIEVLSRRPAEKGKARPARALVLTPTRELCGQVGASFGRYGRHTALRHAVIYGGVSQRPQEEALRRGADILVATPGRLLDLDAQRLVDLRFVETLVLDEADRMLDMGFFPDVRRILAKLPARRQTLFFSATIPAEVRRLAESILRDPARIAVTPVSSPAETVEHRLYYVERAGKSSLLLYLLNENALGNALVFTRTKRGADRLAGYLLHAGIEAEAIHGDRTQGAREKALEKFKKGATRVLVATDVASRGIDIASLSHVVNFELPEDPGSYVHRIGRTGRAGLSGVAVSFCGIEERPFLAQIERLIGRRLAVVEDHPFRSFLRPGPPAPLKERPVRLAPAPYTIPADRLFQGA